MTKKNNVIEFPISPYRKIVIHLTGREFAWIGTDSPRKFKVFGLISRRRLRYVAKVLYEHFYGVQNTVRETCKVGDVYVIERHRLADDGDLKIGESIGSAIGSCGHDITDEDDADVGILVMEHTRSGERATEYCAACKGCRDMYREWGIVLENEEMERAWFSGEIDYPEIHDD